MKIKTCDLIGEELNYAVAFCEKVPVQEEKEAYGDSFLCSQTLYFPSTDWKDGGPIIERERITVIGYEKQWEAHLKVAFFVDSAVGDWISGPTALIAAMRCYVASKMGKEIDLDQLYKSLHVKKNKESKVKTCDLKDKDLDFVVAHLEEIDVDEDCYTFDYGGNPDAQYSPSQDWNHAGPIIERENIAITGISFPWFATELGWWGHIKDIHLMGRTPLIAAMRTYVASKLGEEVDMDTVYEALQVEIGGEDVRN